MLGVGEASARFGTVRVRVSDGRLFSLVSIVAGATWYLFSSYRPNPSVAENTPNTTPETTPLPEPKPPAFSQDTPNPIILDTESSDATPEGIIRLLSETERSVKSASPPTPIEFVFRDANNNPIAFSRLAFLLGLPIPSDILSTFDEGFSLYFVMDQGDIRRAIALDIREERMTTESIHAEEAKMPAWFSKLLYPASVIIPNEPTFRSGSYGTLATRFSNFGEAEAFSFDYAILSDALIIGTSRDSFRAALSSVIRIR